MRVEPRDGKPRLRNAEIALQRGGRRPCGGDDRSVVSMAMEFRSEACTVTGTTRRSGLASIMICRPRAPVSSARNSVWPG